MQQASSGKTPRLSSDVRTIDPLIDGHRRFCSSALRRHRDQFERLATGQSPLAVFVTCSDSRVQPHLITQADPGDLFVVRNAGNIVPPFGEHSSEGAAIEYAVCALNVPHIVVCGHSGCGAMGGLLQPEALASLPKVRRWVDFSAKALEAVNGDSEDSAEERLSALVRENVLLQRAHLMTYPFVAERVESGALTIHTWTYEIRTGLIAGFDRASRRFVPLDQPSMSVA